MLNSVTPRYRVEYKPGWDCHGLPIELKALQSVSGSDKAISAVELRQLCRRFASDAVKRQKKSIAQWGIMCDISLLQICSFLHRTWRTSRRRAATTRSRRTTRFRNWVTVSSPPHP